MSKLKVLIVGASIAGPTAAYWFAKAGAEVTIIERFPQLRTGGQNIDIRTCGVTVMRKMLGMEAAVRAKTLELEGLSFVRDNGRPYGTLRATGNPDQQSLVSEYEIFRGDLAQILLDMTKDNENIRYLFGEQVVSVQQNKTQNGPVTVEFANGSPTSEYELVVACDGATSRTRAIGLGCGARDYVESANCWAAYFSISQDLLEGKKVGLAHSAVRGRFVAIGPDPSGVSRCTIMGIYPRHDHNATTPFREAMKQGDEALKQFIAKQFSDVGWKTKEIIKGMMESKDFYASEIVQVKPPSLCKGRFVLVGDAGCAAGPTGGGTSLALAGAYLLPGEILKHKGDLAAGLRGYQDRMQPIIKDLQVIPPLVPTVMAPQTAWGLWLRNLIFALIAGSRILEILQRIFASAFASSDKYDIPDYDWVA